MVDPDSPPVAAEARTLNLMGLRLPLRETVVLAVTIAALTLDYYRNFAIPSDPQLSQGVDRPILFLVVPLATLLLLGERPSDYGLRLGDWRVGLPVAVGAMAVLTPLMLLLSGQPDFAAYYRKDAYDTGLLLVVFGADVATAEFLYRGFLMWTLVRLAGPSGVLLATIPFVFTHFGKPELETWTTLAGGVALGWLAWRTRSVLYGAMIHVFILDLLVWAANR